MDDHEEMRSPRGRRFLRLFLMLAGGLAAPSLALAAFFLSSTGGGDAPATKSATVEGGRVTTTTRARTSAPAPAPTTTTSTAPVTTAPQPSRPPRDPFAPLVTQVPAGGPAR